MAAHIAFAARLRARCLPFLWQHREGQAYPLIDRMPQTAANDEHAPRVA